jgi:hypothetical protein
VDNYSNGPRRSVSGERKTFYYIGMALIVIGFLLFISVFFSGFMMMGRDPFDPGYNPASAFIRAPIGIGLIIVGRLLMNAGARGLAGSGVILDPQQAREDLEPWARMGGGVLKDALDEADVNLSGRGGSEALTFDEKLRRLDDLRKEGLLSEEEFQQKRAEILKQNW